MNYQLYMMHDWDYFLVNNGNCHNINLELMLQRNSIDNPLYTRIAFDEFVAHRQPGTQHACVLAQGDWITLKEISLPVDVSPSNNYRLDMERTEQEAIQKALEITGNDRKAAARLLGISRSTLYLKLKKYGLI